MTDVQKRNNQIDVINALGIIAVVISHTDSPLDNFVSLFHVAIFFIAAGFFFKNEYTISIRSIFIFLKKKFYRLWVPFIIWNTFFLLLQNLFITVGLYSSDDSLFLSLGESVTNVVPWLKTTDLVREIGKVILFAGGTQLGGTMWFLRILFQILCVYAVVNFILFKVSHHYKVRNQEAWIIGLQGVFSLLFLFIGYWFSVNKITTLGIGKTCSYYFLVYLGQVWKLYMVPILMKWKRIHILVIGSVSLVILLVFSKCVKLSYSGHIYTHPLILFSAAITGWCFVWMLSFFILETKNIESFFSYLGRESLIVMIIHPLCFKIVSLFWIIINIKPMKYLAIFPSISNIGVWWIVYVVVGLILSLFIAFLINNGKKTWIKLFVLFRRKN